MRWIHLKLFFFLQDKVANIWCSISVLIKVKRVLTQTQIIKLRLVIAFYARDWSVLCQSALWDFFGTLLSLNATSTFPVMHLICPPKFCISIVFNFSWDSCNTQEKWKTKGMQKFGGRGGGGANKVHYGKCVSGVLRGCAGKWVKIRPLKQTHNLNAILHRTDPVPA